MYYYYNIKMALNFGNLPSTYSRLVIFWCYIYIWYYIYRERERDRERERETSSRNRGFLLLLF